MAITWMKLALALSFFGITAFALGIVAQDKQPLFGTLFITGDGEDSSMECRFPLVSVAMGSASLVSLLLTILLGHLAVLYPYTDHTNLQSPPPPPPPPPVPRRALFRSTALILFFVIAEAVSAAALVMLLRATITQGLHATGNVVQHRGTTSCPADPKLDGHFGGAALLALDATLMWFVCHLLALEARANYLDLHHHQDANNKKQDDHHDAKLVFAASE